jgi:hypothetical protein
MYIYIYLASLTPFHILTITLTLTSYRVTLPRLSAAATKSPSDDDDDAYLDNFLHHKKLKKNSSLYAQYKDQPKRHKEVRHK